MKNSYKVIVKTNQGAEKSTTHDVPEPGSRWVGGLKIKAVPGGSYQLIDNATGQGPDNIRAKRVGKDLHLSFEGRENDDLVISNYFDKTETGFGAVIGEASPGIYHEYIPESGETSSFMANLPDGATNVGMALGGYQVGASGAAVGALVAAAGFNPLWALPLALLGAGGGGGSAAAAVIAGPKITQAKLHQEDDTGISNTDSITGDNTPRILVDADPGATVTVKINGKEYAGKEVSAGRYEVPVTDALPDGLRTFDVVVKNTAGGTSTFAGTPFVIDTSSANNYVPPDQTKPTTDPNNGIVVTIKSITTDTGSSESDFYTSDNTLDFTGTVGSFTNNGDMVELFLRDASAKVIASEYVLPADGQWNWKLTTSMPALVLADGKYTITAKVVDKAGNAVSQSDSEVVIIDTDGGKNQPDGSVNPNTSAKVDITAITTDSGISASDFITNDQTLTYSGTVTDFTANGDKVMLELLDSGSKVIASNYVDATVSGKTGSWNWAYETEQADGQYTVRATVVDKAGNRVNANSAQDTQVLTIKSVADGNNPNKNATVDVTGITTDSGFSANDFITKDKTLTYSGKVTGFLANNGDNVMVELLKVNGPKEESVATSYVMPGANGEWTWAYQQTQSDGIYNVRATIVDKSGNRVNLKDSVAGTGGGQDVQEVKIDNTPANNSNMKFGIAITSIDQDSGSSNSDFLTNVQKLSFKGKIDNYETDFNSNVLVQILDVSGKVLSIGTTTVNSSGVWAFDNTSKSLGGDGLVTQYILKASMMDAAGNILKSTDHSFVIDLEKPRFTLSGNLSQNIFLGLKFTASEGGNFVLNNIPQDVGAKSLTLSQSKNYAIGEFNLKFMDLAGNGSVPNDQLPDGKNASPWDLRNGVELDYVPVSGPSTFSGNEVVGSIGKYVLAADVPVYDLAGLHANIPKVDDLSVHNHIGLSGSEVIPDAAHTLNLTTSDVLALGVKNSFSTNGSSTSDGRIQMRIDGGDRDTVNLDDVIGDKNYVWTPQSDVKIGTNTYDAYVNFDLNLEVFIQKEINLYLV
ncbi:Ig-like domain-containing protein [Limnohabitans sp. DM1]|uniref:Ig-like domain-containing protein n=1 Tax=Limnohabitans sp. DM1 TaxID=1597955 RepID=UPI000B050C80|nr:Ig-like domain-containing protein [Limnohabitans sp. DM1]